MSVAGTPNVDGQTMQCTHAQPDIQHSTYQSFHCNVNCFKVVHINSAARQGQELVKAVSHDSDTQAVCVCVRACVCVHACMHVCVCVCEA